MRPPCLLARSTLAALAALLTTCADSSRPPLGTPTPSPTATATPGNRCAGITPVAGRSLALQLVASGLDRPLHLTTAPGDLDRLYVVEQPGRIRVIREGGLVAEPFLDITPQVTCCGERGLLSLAFHPGFAANRRFFVYYTGSDGDLQIAEYQAASPDRADATSGRIRLAIEHSRFANHNGGLLVFGPDGRLYAGVGDGGGAGDPMRTAQDPAALLGKLLRLDVDGPALAAPGNPFGNEVWALGLRNPWRFAFDRTSGDLYIGDVGQSAWEEIDYAAAGSGGGRDYGWSAMEGRGHCFNDPACNSRGGFTLPVLEYPTGSGCAVTGGHVYRGCALPDLHGTYFYGDFCAGFVRSFRIRDGAVSEAEDWTARLGSVPQLASFGEDERGEIYLVSLTGSVFRLAPR